MKYWLGVLSIVALTLIGGSSAYADASLQLQPLEYRESLEKGEYKKGFVDITNPSSTPTDVSFRVQGFRQINNKGELAFYDDPQLSSGIQLDYSEAQIPAKKTLRLYFIIDGSKLPTGDVFAAIFAQNITEETGGSVPSVQLGTLLLITNETPASHKATVTNIDVPWLNIGESVEGNVSIKNIAPSNSSNGFFPDVMLNLWPLGTTSTLTGPLIYAGNTREVTFHEFDDRIGIYRLSATHGDSTNSRWIIIITGFWRWVVLVIVSLTAVIGLVWARLRHFRVTRRHR